jgi:hypothetical protein
MIEQNSGILFLLYQPRLKPPGTKRRRRAVSQIENDENNYENIVGNVKAFDVRLKRL